MAPRDQRCRAAPTRRAPPAAVQTGQRATSGAKHAAIDAACNALVSVRAAARQPRRDRSRQCRAAETRPAPDRGSARPAWSDASGGTPSTVAVCRDLASRGTTVRSGNYRSGSSRRGCPARRRPALARRTGLAPASARHRTGPAAARRCRRAVLVAAPRSAILIRLSPTPASVTARCGLVPLRRAALALP